ncbi:polysaccharide biosynthesis protein [Idiomarina seosinensis]|uniref:polysaccharide biosynthesis protein n=1 Tax=Idiomarina seosinensis TaxID=281739 RepID=UPI00384D4739
MLGLGLVRRFFEVPRWAKRAITLICDASFISLSLILALMIRVGEDWSKYFGPPLYYVMASLTVASILIWIKLGLYRAVIRYMDIKVLANILWGALASTILLVGGLFLFNTDLPRSVPFIYFTLITLLVAGSRLLVRGFINTQSIRRQTNVAIYGAGSAGRQLCASLHHGAEHRPVFFVDDNESLQGTTVNDLRVFSPEFLPELIKKHNVEKVLFAIPSASTREKKAIFNNVQSLSVEMLTIPGSADLINGKVSVNQLRSVDIQDLLGRDSVQPDEKLLDKCIKEKVVMITGAGGSIGSELARLIATRQPRQLILFELSEYNLYAIEGELKIVAPDLSIIPILGSVQDKNQVGQVIKRFGVQTIYHAAAYKHVPLVEYNVVSGARNNILGTQVVAEAAEKYAVEHFVLISTDKAVRPTNVMGASKRLAELVVQDLAQRAKKTTFSMVRFGNVLGSSGSVIPLFKQQIEQGGPVTVTHPDITRYFMTIPEAAALVVQAGAMAKGGEVFVLDMGQPVKIIDLATKMIHLMGLTVRDEHHPDGDIDIAFTGLRPGEKLYEELLIGGNVSGTRHPRIMRAAESAMSSSGLRTLLAELYATHESFDAVTARQLLTNAPASFMPSSELADLLSVVRPNEKSLSIVDIKSR